MKSNTNAQLVVIEQYISWEGHYKLYFDNLVSDDYRYIYASKQEENYPNSVYLKAKYKTGKRASFINFIKGRFVDSFRAYRAMLEMKPKVAHIVEFEPFSFLLLLLLHPKSMPQLLITVHSIDRLKFSNPIKNSISSLQRVVYRFTLRRLAKRGSKFVTHYQYHKDLLCKVIGYNYEKAITVIDYPCPKTVRMSPSPSAKNKLLIYGQIREDKGIYEFLKNMTTESLDITIAGKVYDENVINFNPPNITKIDKYYVASEMEGLFSQYQYLLLPYVVTYPGGAGTFKDSIAYGLPVISTPVPIFKEIIEKYKLGVIVKSLDDINTVLTNTTAEQYEEMVQNCHSYARNHGWDNLRESYFKLYRESLAEIPTT